MEASIGVNLRVTAHSNQGGRKYMEDMFCVAYQPTADDRDLLYAYFGIFDGHGGKEAALYAKHHLMDYIVMQKHFWSDDDELVLKAIREGFLNTHYAMWRELDKWPKTPSGLPSTSGTTASIAFVRRGKLYIGHVGDSGIVMGYEDPETGFWRAKPLTKDHKPETPAEHARISQSGGKVLIKSGVHRVVWNRPRIGHKGPVRRSTTIDEIPFLAVARSLGDLWSYNSEQDEFVVSPCPDVSVLEIDVHSHRCLILGTDGLWNMLTPQDAVNSVYFAEKNNEKQPMHLMNPNDPLSKTWINPSKRLVDRALDRWMQHQLRADNTSVVTVVVDPPGPPKVKVRGHSSSMLDPTISPVGISRYAPQMIHPTNCNLSPACSSKDLNNRQKEKEATKAGVNSCLNQPFISDKVSPLSQPRVSPMISNSIPESSPVFCDTRATTRAKRRGVTRRGENSLAESKSVTTTRNNPVASTPGPSISSAFYPVVSRNARQSSRTDHGNSNAEAPSISHVSALTDDVQINEISSSSEPVKIAHEDSSTRAVHALRTRKGVKDSLPEPPQKKRRVVEKKPPSKPNTRKASSVASSKAMLINEDQNVSKERNRKNSEIIINKSDNPPKPQPTRKLRDKRNEKRKNALIIPISDPAAVKPTELENSKKSSLGIRNKKNEKSPAKKYNVLNGRVSRKRRLYTLEQGNVDKVKKSKAQSLSTKEEQVVKRKNLSTQPISPKKELAVKKKSNVTTILTVLETAERNLRSASKSALRFTRSRGNI